MSKNKTDKIITVDRKALKHKRFPDETPTQASLATRQIHQKKWDLEPVNVTNLSQYNNTEMITSMVEYYMLRNITSPMRLSKLLGIGVSAANAAIKRVHNRWTVITPSQRNMRRGKCLATYERVMNESFDLLDSPESNTANKLGALRLIGEMNTKIAEISGVKAVEGTSTVNTLIMQGDDKRNNIAQMNKVFESLLKQAPEPQLIEHDSNQSIVESHIGAEKIIPNENNNLGKTAPKKEVKMVRRTRPPKV